MIIFRYLSKEIGAVFLAVTLLLLGIFLSNQLVRYLGYAVDGRLVSTLLFHMMLLEIPQLLGLLLPLGLFLGILLAYGRLYVDNEMVVLVACGMSRAKLVSVTLPFALLVTLLVSILTLWISPRLMADKNKILAQSSASLLETLLPGRFQATADGQKVFYVESMSRDRKEVRGVFVAERSKNSSTEAGGEWSVFSANSGYQMTDNNTGDRFIVITDGYRFQGTPGQKDYRVAQFAKYGVFMPEPKIPRISDQDSRATLSLWQDRSDPPAQAELQWRISAPLSALILALLAVPLSRVKPRQGKYAPLLPAVLIYIIYANMLFVGRAWVGEGVVSPIIGMWWIHAIIALLALTLILQQSVYRNILSRCYQRLRGST